MKKLVQILRQKSEEFNLFSKGDREKLESKHIPDALAVLDFWDAADGDSLIDIGTGGGLPGLALAIEKPEMDFVLLDATEKKIKAVKEVAEELGLSNVSAVSGRAEDLAHDPDFRECFDFATARALASLPTLLEYASGFLKVGGRFFAWKSRRYQSELNESENAQDILGLKFLEAFDYELPDGETRSILVFEKERELFGKYPRNVGIPKKRPL